MDGLRKMLGIQLVLPQGQNDLGEPTADHVASLMQPVVTK